MRGFAPSQELTHERVPKERPKAKGKAPPPKGRGKANGKGGRTGARA